MGSETNINAEVDIRHIKLAVPLDAIMRLKPFISLEATRYYLNGVRFEKCGEGALLVATDGHRMGALRVEGIAQSDGIVHLPPAKPKLDSLQRKEIQWLIVGTFAGEELALVTSLPPSAKARDAAERAALSKALAIYPRPLIDGNFPDWRRVVPSTLGRRTASFNAAYLGQFLGASGEKAAALTLYGDTDSAAHIVDLGDPNFLGVLMPMRADSMAKLPDWLDLPAKKPARKKAA